MATVRNVSPGPLSLTGGRVLAPGGEADVNETDPHEAALISVGDLEVIDPNAPAPLAPPAPRFVIVDETLAVNGEFVRRDVAAPYGWVTAAAGGASAITFSPSGGLSSINVQMALIELDTEKQPLDSDLTAIAALATTAYGRAFLALVDAAAGRTALGLGSAALSNTGAFDAAGAGTTAAAAVLGLPFALTGAVAATRFVGGTTSGAPITGAFLKGDFIVDQTGAVHICTTAGSPGTWAAAGGAGGGGAASAITFTPVGTIAATDVQTAVAEVATDAIAREALKADLASPALTGNPTAPTQAAANNSTRLATTAYTEAAVAVETAARAAADTAITANTQTASYTLVLADAGKVVEQNVAGANTLTVPLNATVAFPVGTVIQVCQYGAGQVTITPTGGVTLRQASSLTSRAQYSVVTLRKRGTDEWVVGGDCT